MKIRRDVHEKEAAKIIGALRGDNFYENIPLKRYESITKQVMNKEFGALSKEEIARILELKTELHEIRHKEFEINGLFLNAREMESENEILTELAVLAVGPAVYYQLFHVFEGTKAMLAPEYYNDIMRLLAKHLKIDDAGNYEVLFDRLLKKSAEEIRKAASDAYYEFGEKFSVGEIDQGALRMAVQSGIREEGNVQEKAYTTGISSLSAPKNTDDPGDLSEHDFIRLTPKESISKKSAKWHDVKDLDDNNPEKILYFRRFAGEFQPSVSLSPELAKSLQRKDYFGYYALDEAQRVRLSAVSPYTTKLSIPPGVKIGIVVGYHHLEKPWGHLFRAMFEKQVRFPPGSVQFIVIKNGDIPTGDRSVSSEREIQDAVIREGLTHIIDVHEQLSYLNHYMDFSRASEFNDVFRAGDRKNQRGKEYTLDPFVPLWAIEQYYGGYIYPQLQYAVNEQIRKIEILVRNISETSPESSLPSGSSSLVNNSVPFSTITALDNPGGIDFRTLPIVTQAISNLSLDMFHMPLNRLDDLNLNQEWLQIQKIAGAGITPSAERIKEYVQLSCLKGELNDTQKIIACIADILRNEEERCVSTEPILKDILVVLESGRSAQELKAVFTGNQS